MFFFITNVFNPVSPVSVTTRIFDVNLSMSESVQQFTNLYTQLRWNLNLFGSTLHYQNLSYNKQKIIYSQNLAVKLKHVLWKAE